MPLERLICRNWASLSTLSLIPPPPSSQPIPPPPPLPPVSLVLACSCCLNPSRAATTTARLSLVRECCPKEVGWDKITERRFAWSSDTSVSVVPSVSGSAAAVPTCTFSFLESPEFSSRLWEWDSTLLLLLPILFLLGLWWGTSTRGASTHHCISPGNGEVETEWRAVDFLERSSGRSVFLSSSCVGKRNSGHVFTQWDTISSSLIGGQRLLGSTPGMAVPTRRGYTCTCIRICWPRTQAFSHSC